MHSHTLIMFKKKYQNDILLVAVILILTAIVFAIFKSNLKDGAFVKVSIDGKASYSYNLSEDITVPIITGSNKNVLVIKNGEAYIEAATCPDKICVAHRKISKNGETIVCLPHRVVVEITEE